jgi:hypothetical protein
MRTRRIDPSTIQQRPNNSGGPGENPTYSGKALTREEEDKGDPNITLKLVKKGSVNREGTTQRWVHRSKRAERGGKGEEAQKPQSKRGRGMQHGSIALPVGRGDLQKDHGILHSSVIQVILMDDHVLGQDLVAGPGSLTICHNPILPVLSYMGGLGPNRRRGQSGDKSKAGRGRQKGQCQGKRQQIPGVLTYHWGQRLKGTRQPKGLDWYPYPPSHMLYARVLWWDQGKEVATLVIAAYSLLAFVQPPTIHLQQTTLGDSALLQMMRQYIPATAWS